LARTWGTCAPRPGWARSWSWTGCPCHPPCARAGPGGALRGGEDYELLLAVPPSRRQAFERACARAGQAVTRIGVLTRERTWRIRDAGGRLLTPPAGFDHFARSSKQIQPDD
ncbi:hypothetical protein ACLEQD_39680, partial [Corallococcus sp. 4LFB]